MSSEELKPCPCGAACNTEEGPYPINLARDLWRLDCVEPDCGWSIVAGSSEEALKDWNRRAPNALEAENARLVEDVKKWQALAQNVETLERITESAEARRAQLAAIQGGVVEVVAYVTTGFSGGPRTRRAFTVAKADANQQHENWVPHYQKVTTDELMTVAQHQRITAAMEAEVERLQFDVATLIDSKNGLVEECNGLHDENAELRHERDALRAALIKTVASLDQLLPYLGKIPADVGLLNDALVAARPLLEQNTNKEVTPDGK